MSKVLAILAVAATAQPAGQTWGGSYLFKFNDAAQIATAAQATSDDLPDGDYTVSVQALDTNNATMGAPITGNFTLAAGAIVVPGAPAPSPPDTSTYPAPVSLSFSVAP